MMQSPDDVIMNMYIKRQNYRRTGSCTGAVCVGWNAQNVMWAITHDMDNDLGTVYQERLKNWILSAQESGVTVAGALTDPKGDRSLRPSQQANPDANLRIVEVKEDGIVIRGAKTMICGTAAAQEIFLLPGGVYGEDDKDYALACVVPKDIEGLTIIEATHPSDRRELEPTAEDEVPNTHLLHLQLPRLHWCLRGGSRGCDDRRLDPHGACERPERQDFHEEVGRHVCEQSGHLWFGCRCVCNWI